MKSKLTLLILSFCMFGLTSMATTPLPEQKKETTFEGTLSFIINKSYASQGLLKY